MIIGGEEIVVVFSKDLSASVCEKLSLVLISFIVSLFDNLGSIQFK